MKSKMVFLLLILSMTLTGQNFRQIHTLKLPFEPSKIKYQHTDDFNFFLCSTSSEMLMIDGKQGKVLWHIKFDEAFQVKKIPYQLWNKYANVILVYDDDSKKGIAPKYFIDGKTGKTLWKSDKYVSDFGKYELADGFRNYFDPGTGGVLLPTKETVDLVDVYSGNTIWSKKFSLEGKEKAFDCYIMEYYRLVKIITGKETFIHLSVTTGEEVNDIEPYFDRKRALADQRRTTLVNIPEKNCYVIMKGHESKFMNTLGILVGAGTGFQAWKMNFSCYEMGTDKLLWSKDHMIAQSYDWVTYVPFVEIRYAAGHVFVMHEPNLKSNSGLTVLDVETGEKKWEAYYTTTEMKGVMTVVMTPFPAPLPVMYDGNVYVVDKVKNRVCCYDLDTGKEIWHSEKFPDAQKIPSLYAVDGCIIMAYGAATRKIQKSESEQQYCFGYTTPSRRVICSGKRQYVYRYIYSSKDKYGLVAYDAATGKTIWSSSTIKKAAKDKFSYIAATQYVNNKLYCVTNKKFFVLNPVTGAVLSSLAVSKEKVGDIWGMVYFEKQNLMILNCTKGIIKIDLQSNTIAGVLKTPNIQGLAVSEMMDADDPYSDYAIYASGKPSKMKYSKFASIDLDRMMVRGVDEASLLESDNPRFSTGAEMFYKVSGKNFSVYSVK